MKGRRRGFTLVELTVVIAVLVLLSSAVLPNLAAFQASQKQHRFLDNLVGLGARGREMAIGTGRPVDLEYDDPNNAFKLHTTDANGGDQDVTSVSIPDPLKAGKFILGQKESNAAEWKLNFYPDGSSDGGGVELSQGDTGATSLYVQTNGQTQLIHDSLPDPKAESWQAGDYVHRSQ